MTSPPPPRSFAAVWTWVLTLLLAPPAARDAGSVPSDRGRAKGNEGVLDDGRFAQAAQQAEASAGADQGGRSGRGDNPPRLILDSVARRHVTGDESVLSALTAADPGGVHRTRDGRELLVAGAGTATGEKFQLPGVLYVPGLAVAGIVLVSVQQLADRGLLVVFGSGRCSVKDSASGRLIGGGRLHDDDGFYHLDFLRIPADGTDA